MKLSTLHKRKRRKLKRQKLVLDFPVLEIGIDFGFDCGYTELVWDYVEKRIVEVIMPPEVFGKHFVEVLPNDDGTFSHHFFSDVLDSQIITDVLSEEIIE